MQRIFRPLLLALMLILVEAFPASAAMTAREFVEMTWTREKLAVMEEYVSHFEHVGYAKVPDVYALTARMELNVHTDASYATWLDILALQAALELGMHR